jgi:hypothetical protein
LDLPGSELAVQGRRPDERIFGKFEPRGAHLCRRLRRPRFPLLRPTEHREAKRGHQQIVTPTRLLGKWHGPAPGLGLLDRSVPARPAASQGRLATPATSRTADALQRLAAPGRPHLGTLDRPVAPGLQVGRDSVMLDRVHRRSAVDVFLGAAPRTRSVGRIEASE